MSDLKEWPPKGADLIRAFDWLMDGEHPRKYDRLHMFGVDFRRLDGVDVRVSCNYRVEGIYSPEQRVLHAGVIVTVWLPTGWRRSEAATVTDWQVLDAVEELVDELVAKARDACQHYKSREVGLAGRCLHVYRCPDCNAMWQVDTSD